MTQFLDGPAKDQCLSLKRAPLFLRVVQGVKWDALDLIGDIPNADEKLFAYYRIGEASDIHLCGRGSGWFKVARYKFFTAQPDDATMRDGDSWQTWCQRHDPISVSMPCQETVQ